MPLIFICTFKIDDRFIFHEKFQNIGKKLHKSIMSQPVYCRNLRCCTICFKNAQKTFFILNSNPVNLLYWNLKKIKTILLYKNLPYHSTPLLDEKSGAKLNTNYFNRFSTAKKLSNGVFLM